MIPYRSAGDSIRRHRRPAWSVVGALVMVLALIGGACADGRKSPADPPPPPSAPANGIGRSTYVALGGSETRGAALDDPLHAAWPQLIFARLLPPGSVYVNLAGDDATAADALTTQLPLALQQQPTLATVWLGPADQAAGTPPDELERDLTLLLAALRRGGAARVLVAVAAPGTAGTSYEPQVTAAARRTGAELVRLPATASRLDVGGSDGVAGHAAAADAFGRALSR